MSVEKINGLTQKPHPYQIISYFFFAFVLLTYFLIVFPLSSDTAKVIGAILEAISGVFVLASGYIATVTDPSDPYLKKFRQAQEDEVSYEAPSKEFYCRQDHTHVMSTSKHCKRCGRCTEEFDHHCKWINNDVGKQNYKSFFVMIFSVMVFLTVYLIFGILLTVSYASDSKLVDHNIWFYDHSSNQIMAVMIVLWVFMGLSAAFLTLDTNLVLFHMYLSYKGLTTFQYITAVEERKEYEKELEYAIQVLGGKKKTCLDFVLCLKKKRISSQPVPVSGSGAELKNPESGSINFGSKDKKDLEQGSVDKMMPFKSADKVAQDDTQNEIGEGSPREKLEIQGDAVMVGHAHHDNHDKNITPPQKTNKLFENDSPILKEVYETSAPMIISIDRKEKKEGENVVEVKKSLQKIIDAPIMSTTPEIIKNKHSTDRNSSKVSRKKNERLSLDSDEDKKENAKNSFNIFSNPGSNMNNSRAMAYSIDKLKNEPLVEKVEKTTTERSNHVNILEVKGFNSPTDVMAGRNLKVEKSPQSKRDDTYPDDIAIETFRDAEKVL